jgi:hypothetical protein
MQLLLLPCGVKKWVSDKWIAAVKGHVKTGRMTAKQRAHLTSILREVQFRRRLKTSIYSAGMYTTKGVPASRGKRALPMPFGTWYYKPKN